MRESLWEFLTTEQAHENGELTPGWARDDCSTWTDERYNDPQAGLMGGAAHCDAFWQCRTLPRVCEGFATIYGTDELVTSFDRASINRPQACGSEAVLKMGSGPGRLDAGRLHTHFNQDGYGEDVLICYGILPLWDMNRTTGATTIVPGNDSPLNSSRPHDIAPAQPHASAGAGSHKKVKEIEGRRREFDREVFAESPGHQARSELFARFRKLQDSGDADATSLRKKLMQEFRALPKKYPEMAELEAAAQDLRRNFFEPFNDVGLAPGICDVKAGDLCASNPPSALTDIPLGPSRR